MMDIMYNLKKFPFYDHELRKLPKLHMSKCMPSVKIMEGDPIQLVPMEQDYGLDKSGIISLLYVPHFGRTTKVNTCVKQLLVCFHEICMWLYTLIYVDVNLIHFTAGLPKERFNPVPFFVGNEQDKIVVARMKEKYNITRNNQGFDTASINEHSFIFAAKALLSNVL